MGKIDNSLLPLSLSLSEIILMIVPSKAWALSSAWEYTTVHKIMAAWKIRFQNP